MNHRLGLLTPVSGGGASQTAIGGTAMNAVARDSVVNDQAGLGASDAPGPWARRVLWVGGLTQCAFGVFWLARGSAAIGGVIGITLLAVSALCLVGLLAYARQFVAGTAPRPSATRRDKA